MGQNLDVDLGGRRLILHNRYETLSIANDALIAVWFIVGSILFFHESSTTAGTWLFLIGSIELLIRPVIRLSRNIHLSSVPKESGINDF
ncbi:YrhK family protein [Arthrobacter agilis]|uniref:YrhK family protein n=1 Tax=Arthrobacter agilis TaxID=37921 RepID=UPI002366889C|nr:YrhK family protein [Arthrobacter agilis]WDF33147.1 YrhK family protein [Arthrobacter agilis]